MKLRLLAGVSLVVWFVCTGTAQAVEPYLEFVQALRNQGYHDYAILYLDQISAKSNTPAEIKQVISYQKAVTLQENAKTVRSPEKQLELLSQAQGFLEDFVKQNPNHPNAADANTDRATILLDKGKAENEQAKSPSNQGTKRDLQNRARATIGKAREVFQTAFDQLDAAFKKFPTFVDPVKDADQYAARANIEKNLIMTTLRLGMCTYEEAQTHDPSANEFKQLLNKAADEFEKMHQKYRSQVAGLHARAWQGKCFEEQRDLQKALGIYNELLAHPGNDSSLEDLKTQTLYFKLICLNSKERKDYQLAADQADEWLKKHQNEGTTRLGLSIQYQQAVAYEELGNNPELIKPDKERYLKQARNSAEQVQKFASEHKEVAAAMVSRLNTKLGGKDAKVDTFDAAVTLARQALSTATDLKKEIDEAIKLKKMPDEIAKMKADQALELNDAYRNFELAFTLIKPNDDKKNIATARLHFAHVNYYLHRNYEAAVLGQYVARTASKDDSTVALDAAYIAMAAFVQAYNENKAPNDQKGEDMRMIVKAANLIADRWPSSDKANDAFMILGRMLGAQKKPAEAAAFFGKVPETDSKYAEAQLAAGQAYATAYAGSHRMLEKPAPEKLAGWLKSAQDHLRKGIDKMSPLVAPQGPVPGELIAAKVSLAQIIISQGKEAEALKLLLDDPQSVVKAVHVEDEALRPENGVTSRKFATETYKLVLRAYIGTDNLDKARETMKTLEKIGGDDITELYVDLGKKLKDELERFRQAGETERFEKLMTSFETFLNDMASRKEGQTFGSLSWIGETYFALGETVANDAAKANAFYDKAGNAFTEILTRSKDDQNFALPIQMYDVKLRQIRVYRFKKDYPPAEPLVTEILKDRPNDLKVQTAAAEFYQDWGRSGLADGVKRLLVAIQGTQKQGGNMWGWGEIGKKLQKSQEFATNPVYVENFLNARFHGTSCRMWYGMETPKDKQKALEGCRAELMVTVSVTKDMPEEWVQKFNALYREVLTNMGKVPEDLPRAINVAVAPPVKPEPTELKPAGAEGVNGNVIVTPPPPGPDLMTWIIFGSCLVGGVVAVGWLLLKPKSAPKAKAFGTATVAGPVSFSGVSIGDALPAATFVAPKPKPRPAGASGGTAGSKPATKPAAPAGAAAPKPKPRPPSPPPSK